MSRGLNLPSRLRSGLVALGLLTALVAPAAPPKQAAPAAKTIAGYPEAKALALGQRMYREGLQSDGKPMQSVVSGDIPVPGTIFTCVSCHVRSGVGSYEGGVVTQPTNAAKLAVPRFQKYPNLLPEERKNLRVQTPAARPAYTDETLATLIRTGIDSGGREVNPIMPRYDLNDTDMALLVHYLWNLSPKLSPGVDATTIHFATIVTDDVSEADQQAMLVPLKNYVARHNVHPNGFGNRMYMSLGGREMSGAFRKLDLAVWRLKGAPATWDRQLEAYLAKAPIFALLGGISNQPWQPIHAFCERHSLPCLLPITDLPVISDHDWYTQYFSKGYYQEGQAVARYLNSLDDPAPRARILQIVQDGPQGRDLAQGFDEAWKELEQSPAKVVRLKRGETLTAAALAEILKKEQPTSLLVWLGPEAFAPLQAVTEQAGRPTFAFLSGRLLGTQVTHVPEAIRPWALIAWPYRNPAEELPVTRYAYALMAGLKDPRLETRISTRTYSMLQLFQFALADMDRNLYRDNFFDRIGMQRDFILPDYLRLSFGPGQRYASKGCYIMQVSAGPEPKLVPKSEWVIH
ncbi:MAG: amino acid ABC transporter substrate-binding protein [Holophagaceae bacterium]|nr:amino acid ABC transporter substrate-binding protein [Holophagaceae bacterium]